jgi:hypothetical protein
MRIGVLYQCVLVRISVYQCVLVRIGAYLCVLVRIRMLVTTKGVPFG